MTLLGLEIHLLKREQKDPAEDAAAYDFADAYGKHHERNGVRNLINILQNKRNNQYIRDNRRKGAQECAFCFFTGGNLREQICSDCAEKCCDRAEDNIEKKASRQCVREDASDVKSGNGCRCKEGKDGEGFGKPELDHAACKADGITETRQSDVERCGDSCHSNEIGVSLHFLFGA